jgi:hypothetical protein
MDDIRLPTHTVQRVDHRWAAELGRPSLLVDAQLARHWWTRWSPEHGFRGGVSGHSQNRHGHDEEGSRKGRQERSVSWITFVLKMRDAVARRKL